MPELSLHNIDQISRDINREEISFSHLLHDLIDHVCCDVDNEMQTGLSFDEAYKRVRQKMGARRLKEIQEETLYAVDSKYRYMKNTMKISGIAGTVMLGFASTLKIMHFPGAGILMTLGALILAFVFLPSSLRVLWKETHNKKRLFMFISAFFAGIFFILGTLFKIQHWPGAGYIISLSAFCGILFFFPSLLFYKLMEQENKAKRPLYFLGIAGIICYVAGMLFKIQHWPLAIMLMFFGVILLFIIVIPWYTWLTWRADSTISPRFIFVLIGSLLIVVPGALINLSLQHSYNYGFYSNLEQQHLLFNYKVASNVSYMNQYRDSSIYSEMEQLHSETTELLAFIGNVQTKMVAESEGKPGMPAIDPDLISQTDNGPEIQYSHLSNPFNTSQVANFLFPESNTRRELNKILSEYSNYLVKLSPGNDIKKFQNLLDPAILLPAENQKSEEISLMSGLHSLELLKNSVLTVESYIMTVVVNK